MQRLRLFPAPRSSSRPAESGLRSGRACASATGAGAIHIHAQRGQRFRVWFEAKHASVIEKLVFKGSRRHHADIRADIDNSVIGRKNITDHFAFVTLIKTAAQAEQFLARRLDALKLCMLMLDGVHVAEYILLVAVGIDERAGDDQEQCRSRFRTGSRH